MKKISIIIMALVILLSAVFTAPAYAVDNVETAEIDGVTFEYRILNGKYAKIIHGDKFIPEEINGYPVTVIGTRSYSNWDESEEISAYEYIPYELSTKWVIPDTVTCIEDNAFDGNGYINSIKIPPSVTYIGKEAFSSCYNLKQITIPDSISIIEPYTFRYCSSLSTVTLSDEIRKIREYAFANCNKLKKINFPRELRYIGEKAFNKCNKLLEFDFTKISSHYSLGLGEKCITNKESKIIDCTTAALDYAGKNDIEFLFAPDSNKPYETCYAGDEITLFIGQKKLTDYSTTTPNIIKLTKDGKLTALKKGLAKFKVTLPNGKVYKSALRVLNNPVLKNYKTYKKVTTVYVKLGKTVSVRLFGKAKSINNKYTSTAKAEIVSKKSASTIKIKGKAKGTSTVKIKVNGVKTLKLKVTVK